MKKQNETVAARAAQLYAPVVFSRMDLISRGLRGRDITRALKLGKLTRLRRDRYALPALDEGVAEAVRVGGRLSCLSLLHLIGVFVHVCNGLHVHVIPGTSRIRPPLSEATVLHWSSWSRQPGPRHVVPLVDAVSQAIRCQSPRAAIATLDSVLHHGLLTRADLSSIFARLPARYRSLLALVDASAASGPETFMRLILRGLGARFETQVLIPRVGYVDFVVNGWLIIECDSRKFHEGWQKQVEDRRRDIAAARQGYVTIRPLAADIMGDGAYIRGLVSDVLDALGQQST